MKPATMDRPSIPRLCGMVALVIGVTALLGWIFRNPVLLQLYPNQIGMVINTAVGLTMAGLVLILARSTRWSTHIRVGCGVVLFTAGTLVLAESLLDVDLGLDWVELHQWL